MGIFKKDYYYLKSSNDLTQWVHDYTEPKDSQEISFKDFERYILNKETMEGKKIIGYKAPYDLYEGRIKKGDILTQRHSGQKLAYYLDSQPYNVATCITSTTIVPKEIAESWEPVYEKSEVTVNMGEFNVVVKDGEIWHKSDKITNFCKELVEKFSKNNVTYSFGGYNARLKEVEFEQVGCQKGTKLSDWRKLWDIYQQNK